MDRDIAEFERKKQSIRTALQQLDKKCKLSYGPLNKYVPPMKHPFNLADAREFKRRAMGSEPDEKMHLRKHCKFMADINKDKDDNNRYFKHIQDEYECSKVKGVWDPAAINRENKFSQGVCWVSEDNKTCGEQSSPLFLRPYHSKFKNLTSQRLEHDDKCHAVPGCTWKQQSTYTWDCVKGVRPAPDDDTPVMTPPKDMPVRDGLETFLYRWYNSNTSPLTTELMGEGNRCKGTIVEETSDAVKKEANGQSHIHQYLNVRILNPMKAAEATFLKQHMSAQEFTMYKRHWNELKINGAENFNEKYNGTSMLDTFYARMDHKQFMEGDPPLPPPEEVKKKRPLKKDALYPSVPQSIVNMIMKQVAMTNGDRRGILAWHSTGSGKSCTATGVMDAFWDTDRPIIFASSVDAIASNPDYKFHECAMNLYPRFQLPPFVGKTKEESMALVAAAFKRRNVRFLTFAKLSNRVVNAEEYKKNGAKGVAKKSKEDIFNTEPYVDLDNAVLIIDEVHNLFRPLANQKKEHERLEKEILDPKKHPNMKVVILTATPGDNIPDVLKLLNIIRMPSSPLITLKNIQDQGDVKAFKDSIRGMVSYFDMSSDTTKFPIVYDSGVFIKAPMSELQLTKYIEAYKTVKGDIKDFDALAKANQLNKYWEPPRKYANMLFNFDKDMKLSDFSTKLPLLLAKIQEFPTQKQYVYSSFYTKMGYGGHGIVAIAKELEKKGYKKLTVADAKKYNDAGKLPPPGKRYILAITTEIGEEGGNAGKNLHELIKIYNHAANKDGRLIHVMLASQGFNEGIDLKGVRHIHFFEPLVTMASDKQTLGRAARYCSHADLDRDKGEWSVHIHRYMSDLPPVKVEPDPTPVIEKINNDILVLQAMMTQESLTNEIKALREVKKKTKNQKDVSNLEKQIASKMEEMKANKAKIKADITKKQKEIKELTSPKKKGLDVSSVDNVEERIFKESRERMKELLTVYQSMKEAAVDCHVLKEFHSATGHGVQCTW